jgi:methylenetetrahydrofolate dehydrogenase (NADP+) / methenyltetrahydrofolate cyclohydrolase
MLLQAKDLILQTTQDLLEERRQLSTSPGIALLWVGNDPQTKAFIRVKQQKAKLLGCDFFLHHLERAGFDQLAALMKGLNRKKDIHGIVLQLPLPRKEETQPMIDLMVSHKDIDHLRPDSPFDAPTPMGILTILKHNNIDPAKEKTVILGAGRLVGAPLAQIFDRNGWPYTQIKHKAKDHIDQIRQHSLLISGTGVANLVSAPMVHKDMVVVDGSGVDVDLKGVEPIARAVTPSKGAVGPMTVCFLFKNLLQGASDSYSAK